MGLVKPKLTLAVQPLQELAGIAIDWLLDRIEVRDSASIPPRQASLPPKIVLGESCADLRGEPAGVAANLLERRREPSRRGPRHLHARLEHHGGYRPLDAPLRRNPGQ
jgi:hypothetical protein